MIYSTGYEKRTVPDLEDLMKKYGIVLIVDVRSVPYTRRPDKYEFNRNQMARRFGPAYQWKGDTLGGKHGPATEEGIRYLAGLGDTPILLCLEDDPLRCHRVTDIAARLLRDHGIDVVHLQGGMELPTSQLLEEIL